MFNEKLLFCAEKLLFCAHEGSVGSSRAAIIMDGHCLPIAMSRSSEDCEDGIMACWEQYMGSCEEFFGALGISNVHRGMGDKDPLVGGLFVYEINFTRRAKDGVPRPLDVSAEDYDPNTAENDDGWEHLRGGDIRRPSGVELLRLTQGEPPWEDGVVI